MNEFDLTNFSPCGTIRPIDDLGRIVIPKDFRMLCAINAGDSFEIFCEKETARFLLIPINKSTESEIEPNDNRGSTFSCRRL